MLFRLTSQVTANLTMLQADGETVLRLLGKAPSDTGVITAEQLPTAIAALDAAAQADRAATRAHADELSNAGEDCEDNLEPRVTLAQRLAPVLGLLRQAQHEQKAVVWGV